MKTMAFGQLEGGMDGLHYAHRTTCPTGVLHDHDYFEVFLLLAGTVIHCVNGLERPIGRGSALFVRPNDRHCFRPSDDGRFEYVNLAFTRRVLREAAAYLEAPGQIEALCAREIPAEARLSGAALDAVSRETELLFDGALARGARLLLARLLTVFIDGAAKPADGAPAWMSALIGRMQTPENLRGGLPRLYQLCGKSPAHISRTFRQQLGVTPTGLLNRMRLNYARFLLCYSDLNVLNVAIECGFDNLSHFYHLFKRENGQTPLNYRREHLAHNRIV